MCVNVVGEVTHSPRPGVLSSLCPRGEETSLAINFAFKRQVRPGGRGVGAANNGSFLDTLFLTAMNSRESGRAPYKRAIEHSCQGSTAIL